MQQLREVATSLAVRETRLTETRNAPTHLSLERQAHLSSSLEELARLAEARQTSVSQQTFAIYADELQRFELEDIQGGLRELARKPRAQFETAYPDLGRVLQAVRGFEVIRTGERYWTTRFEVPYVPCGRHILGDLVHVDEEGNPCAIEKSRDRTLGLCSCRREWLAARAVWMEQKEQGSPICEARARSDETMQVL